MTSVRRINMNYIKLNDGCKLLPCTKALKPTDCFLVIYMIMARYMLITVAIIQNAKWWYQWEKGIQYIHDENHLEDRNWLGNFTLCSLYHLIYKLGFWLSVHEWNLYNKIWMFNIHSGKVTHLWGLGKIERYLWLNYR